MIRYINKKRIAIIQAGTQVIEAKTFDSLTSLESVVIPIGVSKIEDYAFNQTVLVWRLRHKLKRFKELQMVL